MGPIRMRKQIKKEEDMTQNPGKVQALAGRQTEVSWRVISKRKWS